MADGAAAEDVAVAVAGARVGAEEHPAATQTAAASRARRSGLTITAPDVPAGWCGSAVMVFTPQVWAQQRRKAFRNVTRFSRMVWLDVSERSSTIRRDGPPADSTRLRCDRKWMRNAQWEPGGGWVRAGALGPLFATGGRRCEGSRRVLCRVFSARYRRPGRAGTRPRGNRVHRDLRRRPPSCVERDQRRRVRVQARGRVNKGNRRRMLG